VNQFGNPANPHAHERTTGPEIGANAARRGCRRCGVGSGGTLTGLGRFFNRVKPRRGIEMVLADPTGSILYEYVKTGQLVKSGSWAVEGIGEDFIPEIADMSLVTEAFEIDDEESFAAARELCARKESSVARPLAHFSPARCVIAASKQNQTGRDTRPDTGNKYLSKMYNNFWMAEQGFIHRPPHSDLSD